MSQNKRLLWVKLVLLFAAALMLLTPAFSQDEPEPAKLDIKGYYRLRYNIIENSEQEKGIWSEANYFVHRLRLFPTLSIANVKVKMDMIVGQGINQSPTFNGVMGNAPVDVAGGFSTNQTEDNKANIEMVRVWGEATTPIGLIKAGRFESNWGLGVWANGGLTAKEFGDTNYGDTYDRFQWFMPIGELIVAAAYSQVSNGSSNIANQDEIRDIILALIYVSEDKNTIGGLVYVRRKQKNGLLSLALPASLGYTKDLLNNVISPYAKVNLGNLYIGAEAVYYVGEYTKGIDTGYFSTGIPNGIIQETTIDIAKTGVAGYVGMKASKELDVRLKFGYASGQDIKETEESTEMTMDPDYTVGLLMFNQYGGIKNCMYINPIVIYDISTRINARLGILYAQTNEDDAGGEAGALGYEVDARIEYTVGKAAFGIEAAYFKPGAYYTDQTPEVEDTLTLYRIRFTYML